MKNLNTTLFTLFFCAATILHAQDKLIDPSERQNFYSNSFSERIEIRIPNVDHYTILKCDFHTHTVFSDGFLWPTTRVEEAWRAGLDVISITDHIEYRRKMFLNTSLNDSYEVAVKKADELGLLLIKGVEISKDVKDIGHFNALFIKDASPISNDDPFLSIQEALRQGAFITLNHPGHGALDSCVINDFQARLLSKGMIHGIEVFNYKYFYPKALAWSREKKLTVFANTDIHGSVFSEYELNKYKENQKVYPPMTLVFSKDKSYEGIREAIDAGRTLAYFDHQLAGDRNLLEDLFKACIQINNISPGKYSLTNVSDLQFSVIINERAYRISPGGVTLFTIPREMKTLEVHINNVHSDTFEDLIVQLDLPDEGR